jgi:peptide deformylase
MAGTRLTLVPSDDPALRVVAKRVSKPTAVADLAADLATTMEAEGGVGLAAPQVGRSVRLFVTAVAGDSQAFVNPEIVSRSRDRIVWEEGCLSLPRLLGDVTRPKRITVRAATLDGQRAEFEADDLLARVIQHEVDHLDGILFPDRMDDLSKLRTISEEEWQSRFAKNDRLRNEEM